MYYNKEALDYHQIIQQLKDRGLRFRNEQAALAELSVVSYFRIANYLRYFETDTLEHVYRSDCYFEEALEIYYFDKRLRGLLFVAMQSIEVAVRSKIIHHVSLAHGAFWFADPALCLDEELFEENLNTIRREVKRSKEEFIQNHFRKYSEPDIPPVWKTLEVTSFGTLSKLYCNLSDIKVKKLIAREFNLPQHQVLESWLKCAVLLRNCLAHHARIWNRRFPQIPKLSALKLKGDWIDCKNIQPVKLYAQISCLAYMLNSIHGQNDFKAQLKALLKDCPRINIHAMGFPDDWENTPLWK